MMRRFHMMSNKRNKNTKIPVFVLSGMIGFGIGGAIGGAIWVAFDAPHLGFAILGAAGGASLGVASQGWKKAWVLALACAIGFDIGFLIGFFIPLAVWEPVHGQGFLVGAIGGATGGASIRRSPNTTTVAYGFNTDSNTGLLWNRWRFISWWN